MNREVIEVSKINQILSKLLKGEKVIKLSEEILEHKNLSERFQKLEDKIENLEFEIQKYKQYLSLTGGIIVALDREGRVLFLNKKGYEMLEYKTDLVGKVWFDFAIPKEIKQLVEEVFDKLLQGEIEPYENVQGEIVTKSGETIVVLWTNTLIKDQEGNVIGTLSSGNDITELESQKKSLEELNRLMVGRELQMVKLKEKLKELEEE